MTTVSECIEPQYKKKGKYVFGLLQISYKEDMNDSVSYSCIVNIEKLLEQIQAMNLFTDIFTLVVFKDEGACILCAN